METAELTRHMSHVKSLPSVTDSSMLACFMVLPSTSFLLAASSVDSLPG